MSAISGVYVIRNHVNGKVYVGSSANVQRRWGHHRHELAKGVHANTFLQRSWEKHGADAFAFELLECVRPDAQELIEREQFWIDGLGSAAPHGYNLRKQASTNLGMRYSDEARRNMSAAKRGKPQTQEAINARAAGRRGKKSGPQSEAHKAALSAVRKGKKPSAQAIEKRTAALRARWADPAFRESMLAKKRATAGTKRSEEAVRHMREVFQSPEYRAKVAAGVTAHWETRRARRSSSTDTTSQS